LKLDIYDNHGLPTPASTHYGAEHFMYYIYGYATSVRR